MSCQASYIAFALNPAHNVRFSTHPFVHRVGKGLLAFLIWEPVPDMRKKINDLPGDAHGPVKVITVRYVDPFINISIRHNNVG